MSEPEKIPGQVPGEEPEEQEEQERKPPASPASRIIAWVGVVYVVLIVLLNAYPFFSKGEALYGVYPLLIIPGAVGLFTMAVYRLRMGACYYRRDKFSMVALAVVCVFMTIVGLIQGIPYLVAGLRAIV